VTIASGTSNRLAGITRKLKETAVYLITLDRVAKVTAFMNKFGSNLKDKKNVTILQDTKNEFIQRFGPAKYPPLFLYSVKKGLILYEDNEQNLPRFTKQINASAK
jgi:hypothetical protein